MKPHLTAVILADLVAPAWSATKTVTLSVPGMNCAACPIAVKKALTKVDGVARVEVSLDKREAVVTFDDTKAAPEQLTRATHRSRVSVDRQGSRAMNAVVAQSTLTCPSCGHAKTETMPTDACQFFYECERCRAVLRPKPGDCCVYCSFGSTPCPSVQQQARCCG